MINVRDVGAVGDGVTDDTAALSSALSMRGTVYIPYGTYVVSSNLVPRCDTIVGDGRLASVLKPSSTVTKSLCINSSGNYPYEIRGIRIDGQATSGATGIFLGDAGSCAVSLNGITLDSFAGADAVGLRVGDALKSRIDGVFTNGCTKGALFQKVTSGFPTTTYLHGCVFNGSLLQGVHIMDGNSISFSGVDFESSGREGCLVQPGSCGTVQDVSFDGRCWFENNYASDPSKYQLVVDGSAASCTARAQIRAAFFSGNSSTAKSIQLTGAGCAGFVLDNPSVPNLAGQISIANGAYGKVADCSGNWSPSVVIDDGSFSSSSPTLGAGASLYRHFNDWTPTFSTSSGNATASFVGGSVTCQQARFKIIGKSLLIQLRFAAQLQAITPAYIQFTLPGSLTSFDNNTYSPCIVKDTTPIIGLIRPDGGNSVQISRADFGNFGSGAAISAFITTSIEIS